MATEAERPGLMERLHENEEPGLVATLHRKEPLATRERAASKTSEPGVKQTMTDLFMLGANSVGHGGGNGNGNRDHGPDKASRAITSSSRNRGQLDRNNPSEVKDYWLSHANFLDSDPHTRRARSNIAEFEQQFRKVAVVQNSKAARDIGDGMACVVLASRQLLVRSRPTRDLEAGTGLILNPGDCFRAVSTVTSGQDKFVKLARGLGTLSGSASEDAGGGWIFTNIDDYLVVAEMKFPEVGRWWYKMVSPDFVEVRSMPSFSKSAGSGHVLCPDEVCVVGCRCVLQGYTFLRLADGRGWVFESMPPGRNNGLADGARVIMKECAEGSESTVLPGSGNASYGGSGGSWRYQVLDGPVLVLGGSAHGCVLQPRESILVNKRNAAHSAVCVDHDPSKPTSLRSRIWLRLADHRGWIPATGVNGQPLVRLVGNSRSTDGSRSPPSPRHSKSSPLAAHAAKSVWEKGVA